MGGGESMPVIKAPPPPPPPAQPDKIEFAEAELEMAEPDTTQATGSKRTYRKTIAKGGGTGRSSKYKGGGLKGYSNVG